MQSEPAAYLPIYLIAGLYVLTFYMIVVFENVLQAVKPQAVGYGLMIEEIVKVSIALVLIIGFKQLFLGAILRLDCFLRCSSTVLPLSFVWLL